MRATKGESMRRLRFAALGSGVLGAASAIVSVVGEFAEPVSTVLVVLTPALFVLTIVLGALAASLRSYRPELVWIISGILVFWVLNSAVYLRLGYLANNTLDDVPTPELIDLLSTLFAAGVSALLAAVLLLVVAWFVRAGRWDALNGPGGQS
jgi:hypothetical protein